ncbi:MAG: hypothetical protein NXI22_20365 [bacterium]|nr:hypothetical protein [bacterium]
MIQPKSSFAIFWAVMASVFLVSPLSSQEPEPNEDSGALQSPSDIVPPVVPEESAEPAETSDEAVVDLPACGPITPTCAPAPCACQEPPACCQPTCSRPRFLSRLRERRRCR